MKTSVLITGDAKQIMLTPENESEKKALKYIDKNDKIETLIHSGTWSDDYDVFGLDVYECKGGYYRANKDEDSVMFVLKQKKNVKMFDVTENLSGIIEIVKDLDVLKGSSENRDVCIQRLNCVLDLLIKYDK